MPSISNISFSVRLDLTGSPKIVLTDTSTHGLSRTAIFSIRQPDGFKTSGSFTSPSLPAGVNVFESPLRLDTKGNPQRGNYEIVMTVRSTGYTDTTFSRTFSINWAKPVVNVDRIVDVLTPTVELVDVTDYTRSGYTHTFGDRVWTANSTPTGQIFGAGGSFIVQKNGQFYSASYIYSYSPTVVYTSISSSWLSIHVLVTKTSNFDIYATPTYYDLVEKISGLRLQENCAKSCKSAWGEANSLLGLLVSKIQSGYTIGVDDDLFDLMQMLGVTYRTTNSVLLPFWIPVGSGNNNSGGSGGGSVVYGFATNIGNGTNSVYVVNHGLSSTNILVNVWDNLDKELVLCNVEVTTGNTITISFDDPAPVDRYKVVVIKI